MKKILGMLLVFVLLYLGIQVAFRFFGNGHEYQYQVVTNDTQFNIKEKFVNNTKDELNSYYFEINYNGTIFYYQTLTNFGKKDHVIKDIYSHKNNEYSCILPVFVNNQIVSDIMCLKNNIIYYYHDITPTDDLREFANSLTEYGYDVNQWSDNRETQSHKNITIYPNNISDNHYIALTNYKGTYLLNSSLGNKIENVELFKSDIYKRPMSMIFKNYYVTADYNQEYRFNKIITVDLINNKKSEINCGTEISFDSYIQGTYNNSIFIFDRSSKKQYEIDLKKGNVLEVGNESSGIIVYNGSEKTRAKASDAVNKKIMFTTSNNEVPDFEGYTKTDTFGGQETGYRYLYQKVGSKYNVYRVNIQNDNQKTYIFSTTDLNRLFYYNEYVYFLDKNTIKYYSDSTGVRSAVESSELSFNNALIFGVYIK